MHDLFEIVTETRPATAPVSRSHDGRVPIRVRIALDEGHPAGVVAMMLEKISRSKMMLRFYGKRGSCAGVARVRQRCKDSSTLADRKKSRRIAA